MDQILGRIVNFEFESAYKLQMVASQKTFGILRIEFLSSQAHMNHETFELLLASSMFEILPHMNKELLHSIMSTPTEAMSVEAVIAEGVVREVAMVAKGAMPEEVPAEIPAEVPNSPWTSRPRQ